MLKLLKKWKSKKYLNHLMEKSKDYEIPPEIEELAESLEGGYWNYRILQMEYKDKIGKHKYHEKWYEMREVYYKENDEPWAWSAEPETFSIQSIEDAKFLKQKAAEAMIKPILAIKKDKDGEEYLVELNKTIYDIKEKK